MDAVFFMLTCCLSLAFIEPTTGNEQIILKNHDQDEVNSTTAPSLNSSDHSTLSTTLIVGTALTSAVEDNTSTKITTSSPSSHAPTSGSATETSVTATSVTETSETETSATETSVTETSDTETSVTETSVTETSVTETSDTETSVTATSVTETSVTETVHWTSASLTGTSAAVTSVNVSVVNASSAPVLSTRGVRLSPSDRNLTITFSVALGVFALALVAIKLRRCSHNLQFLHQPLNNTEDLTSSDTHCVSGGLYDGHPIYDRVPPARQDESDFRLEFLH